MNSRIPAFYVCTRLVVTYLYLTVKLGFLISCQTLSHFKQLEVVEFIAPLEKLSFLPLHDCAPYRSHYVYKPAEDTGSSAIFLRER